MTNLKKYWPVIIISIVIIFVGAYILANKQSRVNSQPEPNTPAEMILFYSDSCSHCKIVEQYIADNNIEAKLSFQKKEVSTDKTNATLLEKKARECNLDLSQGIGVPFFFDGSKCYMGDVDIINYFKTK